MSASGLHPELLRRTPQPASTGVTGHHPGAHNSPPASCLQKHPRPTGHRRALGTLGNAVSVLQSLYSLWTELHPFPPLKGPGRSKSPRLSWPTPSKVTGLKPRRSDLRIMPVAYASSKEPHPADRGAIPDFCIPKVPLWGERGCHDLLMGDRAPAGRSGPLLRPLLGWDPTTCLQGSQDCGALFGLCTTEPHQLTRLRTAPGRAFPSTGQPTAVSHDPRDTGPQASGCGVQETGTDTRPPHHGPRARGSSPPLPRAAPAVGSHPGRQATAHRSLFLGPPCSFVPGKQPSQGQLQPPLQPDATQPHHHHHHPPHEPPAPSGTSGGGPGAFPGQVLPAGAAGRGLGAGRGSGTGSSPSGGGMPPAPSAS